MKARYRTWLAVPPDERDNAINAHPEPVNGQRALGWDGELRLWYARPGAELSKLDQWLPRPQNYSMDSGDPVTEFAQVLENAGLVLKGLPVMNGTLQRVPTKADKRGVKSGVYKAFLDGRPAGWYRDYRESDPSPVKWTFSGGENTDPLVRLHLRAQAQQNRENVARELKWQYDRQARYAASYVARWPQATTNPYLERKGISAAPGVKQNSKGELVIPFENAAGQIRTYQRIPETGGKDARLLKDAEKAGNWFPLGTPVNGQPILFAEGYATAASLHESSGLPVLMTIDAGNMTEVAQKAREKWPDSRFLFCADNDHHLINARGEPENKGVISALKAAKLTNGEVMIPTFTIDELAQGLTDFNDLDVSRGREAFRHILSVQLHDVGNAEEYRNGVILGTPVNGQPILFAIGHDSATSLHESSGLPVVVTIDADNMIEAAQKAQGQWPDSRFVFCADNDHNFINAHGEPENKGVNSAVKAAELTGGDAIAPAITVEEAAQGLTSFHDLDVSHGRDSFSHLMNVQLLNLGIKTPYQDSPKVREAMVVGDRIFTPESPTENHAAPQSEGSHNQVTTENAMPSRTEQLPQQGETPQMSEITQDNDNYPPEPPHSVNERASQQNDIVSAPEPSPSANQPASSLQEEMVTPAQEADWNAFAEDLNHTTVSGSAPKAATAQDAEPVPASTPEVAADQGAEPVPASAPEAAADQDAEPVPASAPEAVADQDAEPVPASVPETAASQDAEPVPTSTPEVAADQGAEPVPASAPEAAADQDAEPVPASVPETAASQSADPLPASIPESAAAQDAEPAPASAPLASAVQDDAPPSGNATPEADASQTSDEITETNSSPLNQKVRDFLSRLRSSPEDNDTSIPEVPQTAKSRQEDQDAPVQEELAGTAAQSAPEPDSIVYAPARPGAQQKIDLDELIKSLKWETLPDNTVMYRVDDQAAFRDLGNRLEMCDGASTDDRKVLAALAVATKFYGGVIELTGSDDFKQNAMRLIVENNIDVRMKLPDQRAQLETLRKELATTGDAVIPHQPTPDLNRGTPVVSPSSPAPQSVQSENIPASQAATTAEVPSAPDRGSPTGPAPRETPPAQGPDTSTRSAPQPDAKEQTTASSAEPPAPTKLEPGESVTAVLVRSGYAKYGPEQADSFFVELRNRSGSHTYWGQGLEPLVKNCREGEAVTLTLNSRDSWQAPGDDRVRVKNNWSMTPVSPGIAVSHERPEQGQRVQAFPGEVFDNVMHQIRESFPDLMQPVRLPAGGTPATLSLGEDRHPAPLPEDPTQRQAVVDAPPDRLIPVMASMDKETRHLELLLVQSAGEHLQGVVRLNGTLYPALASPSADNSQLVINALTDKGPRFAGYGQAVNREPDSNTRPAPQLMQFHLKQQDAPLTARLYTPEQQPAELFQRLGFEQTWQQWSDSQKPEGRQEKTLHQTLSHSPGQ